MPEEFIEILMNYQMDPKYFKIMKEIMTYTYNYLSKDIRENTANIKKQMCLLKSKKETIEERFAIGEFEKEIYSKFKIKYEDEEITLKANLSNSTISSSNLEKAINKALKLSSELCKLWSNGGLPQKKENTRFSISIRNRLR
jgi:site-specific DNA recombinase|tara:strand:+ start:1262 stop:1687 length:426 start_codon:yes stop_codon:yes gene_type:complete